MKYPGRRGKLHGENTVKTPAMNASVMPGKSIIGSHRVLNRGWRETRGLIALVNPSSLYQI